MDMIPQDNTSYKMCSNPDCKNPWLPATPKYFHRLKDGLVSRCKECISAYQKERYNRPEIQEHVKAYRRSPDVQERRRVYQRSHPWKRSNEEKSHLNARQRDRYRSDPEYRKKQARQSKASHSRPEAQERRRTYDKARYYDPVIGKDIRARRRIYESRPEVRERINANKRRPEISERYLIHGHMRRARQRAIAGTYTAQQIQDKLKAQHYRCYYAACGFSKFEKRNGKYMYHIDHTFPLSRIAGMDIPGNSIDYLVLTCPTCNMSKNNRFPHEWPEGGRLL